MILQEKSIMPNMYNQGWSLMFLAFKQSKQDLDQYMLATYKSKASILILASCSCLVGLMGLLSKYGGKLVHIYNLLYVLITFNY